MFWTLLLVNHVQVTYSCSNLNPNNIKIAIWYKKFKFKAKIKKLLSMKINKSIIKFKNYWWDSISRNIKMRKLVLYQILLFESPNNLQFVLLGFIKQDSSVWVEIKILKKFDSKYLFSLSIVFEITSFI